MKIKIKYKIVILQLIIMFCYYFFLTAHDIKKNNNE